MTDRLIIMREGDLTDEEEALVRGEAEPPLGDKQSFSYGREGGISRPWFVAAARFAAVAVAGEAAAVATPIAEAHHSYVVLI
jgi:hypothetical protein